MISLENKSILFLGIGFYDYDECIIKELKRRGSHVTYIKTVPDEIVPRALNRIGLKDISKAIVSHNLFNELDSIKGGFDYVFIIIGDNLNVKHLELLKNRNAKARFILYLWDDIKRVPNYKILAKYCDIIYTFDAKDAEKFRLRFRPLFYRINKIKNQSEADNIKYDYSFVGWNHSVRYNYIHKIKNELEKIGLTYKFILLTRPWLYLWDKYVHRAYCKEDNNIFVFKRLSYNEYIDITKKTRIIVDIPYPSQKGLTIRTIESLAMGKKVLTTNDNINKYGFPDNSYCLLGESIEDFDFTDPLKDTNISVDMKNFTIYSFIDDLFSD